jgi:hypothetical protein
MSEDSLLVHILVYGILCIPLLLISFVLAVRFILQTVCFRQLFLFVRSEQRVPRLLGLCYKEPLFFGFFFNGFSGLLLLLEDIKGIMPKNVVF